MKSKCEIHIMKPHVEKKFAKILKIGRVITIFVRLKKIKKQVNKNQENAFFGHFLIYTKKIMFSNPSPQTKIGRAMAILLFSWIL